MKSISWERDFGAEFTKLAEWDEHAPVNMTVRYALRRLDEISRVEVIAGDDHRLEEARYALRLARNHIDP